MFFFFFNDTATTEIYTLSLHDALPISTMKTQLRNFLMGAGLTVLVWGPLLKADEGLAVVKIPFDFQVNQTSLPAGTRSEEHTSELQSHSDIVCRLLLEKKKKKPPPSWR